MLCPPSKNLEIILINCLKLNQLISNLNQKKKKKKWNMNLQKLNLFSLLWSKMPVLCLQKKLKLKLLQSKKKKKIKKKLNNWSRFRRGKWNWINSRINKRNKKNNKFLNLFLLVTKNLKNHKAVLLWLQLKAHLEDLDKKVFYHSQMVLRALEIYLHLKLHQI